MNRSRDGNAADVAAVLSWGTLAVLGKFAETADPRFVLALSFAIAALIGTVICLVTKRRLRPQMQKRNILFAGLLAAYHLVHFTSFSHAPALHVSLINYLWPALLILLGNLLFRLDSGWPGYAGAGLARFAHHRTCRRPLKASGGGAVGFDAPDAVPGRPGSPESGAPEPGAPDSGLGSRWMAGAGQTPPAAPVAARAAGGGRTAAGRGQPGAARAGGARRAASTCANSSCSG